jgi:hypothetical protein
MSMAFMVKCPICSKVKHIYMNKQRAFYCCGCTHLIKDALILKTSTNALKKSGLTPEKAFSLAESSGIREGYLIPNLKEKVITKEEENKNADVKNSGSDSEEIPETVKVV